MNRRSVLFGMGGAAVAAAAGAGAWRYSTGSMSDYQAYQAALRAPLTAELKDIVRYSTLAANSHNTQPWRYRLAEGTIDLVADFSRRTPVVDPDDHHLFVSLGCAAENLSLAAAASGRPGELSVAGVDGGLRYAFAPGESRPSPLFDAIPARQSTRGLYDGRAVPAGELAQLVDAARIEGVNLALITAEAERAKLRDLVIAANTRQMADDAYVKELRAWLRFNPRSAMRTGDGLFSPASGNPVMPDAIGGLAFGLAFTTTAENEKYRQQMESSAGFAVFTGEVADADHWMRVGRACQRFCLAATDAGLKTAFVNQPVEVGEFRAELAALAGEAGKRPDLVLRFGYGAPLAYSPRRPVASVLD